jgi:hypothetical protein
LAILENELIELADVRQLWRPLSVLDRSKRDQRCDGCFSLCPVVLQVSRTGRSRAVRIAAVRTVIGSVATMALLRLLR